MEAIKNNCIIKDLNGMTEDDFLQKISESFFLMPARNEKMYMPFMPHQAGMCINKKWYMLTYAEDVENEDIKDTDLFFEKLFKPVLGITSLSDERISEITEADDKGGLEMYAIIKGFALLFTFNN